MHTCIKTLEPVAKHTQLDCQSLKCLLPTVRACKRKRKRQDAQPWRVTAQLLRSYGSYGMFLYTYVRVCIWVTNCKYRKSVNKLKYINKNNNLRSYGCLTVLLHALTGQNQLKSGGNPAIKYWGDIHD